MKITVNRALIEVKTLEKRIEKQIQNFNPFSLQIGQNLSPAEQEKKKEFESQAKSDNQSIIDLINRYRKLKAAIAVSNAITTIYYNKQSWLIVELLEHKRSLDFERHWLHQYKTVFAKITTDYEKYTKQTQERLDKLLAVTFAKESSKVKPDEYDAVAKPFLTNNQPEYIDPLNIKMQIEVLEKTIEDLEQEVNIILTESNARTEIEIPD